MKAAPVLDFYNCYTRASSGIGVASTKAMTTQMAVQFTLALALAKAKGCLTKEDEAKYSDINPPIYDGYLEVNEMRAVGVFLSTPSFCQIDAQQHNDTASNLINPHALVQ